MPITESDQTTPQPHSRRILTAIIGAAITLACLVAAFKGIDFPGFCTAMGSVDLWLLVASAMLGLASFNVRALRWQLMLHPITRTTYATTYDVLAVGYLANNVLPARAGEFIRAHILGRRQGISRAAVLGTILAERVLDAVVLLVLAALTVTLYRFSDDVRARVHIGLAVALAAAVVVVGLAIARRRPSAAQNEAAHRPRAAIWRRIGGIFNAIIDGGAFAGDPRRAIYVIALSLAVWAVVLASVWLSLVAMHMEASLSLATLVLVATALGMVVPAAPGGIGTFEFAVIMALSYTGVTQTDAAAYAVLLHVAQLVPICLVGALCAWRCGWSLSGQVHDPMPTDDSSMTGVETE